ncbi:LamG-like jellyroll fold domain-containing protein [Streptomyces sp. TLI_146]|uniref:LamG-like jellyroll fold domain-containing protein n=1 Tax=Streptomyces sp. TLI_146 TaxID=1938858 RepID=UPI000C70734D|nr:LamG-like jellyroll fold domain-containing protein [Streptomyces sp. TLI_146]PKV89959.1 trypsin [Streptomyces sp. TLI_146]
MKLARQVVAVVAAVAACVTTAGTAAAAGSRAPESSRATATDTQPASVVEDFAYPDAEKIRQEKGIVLKRGDGHIVLAECGTSTGLMEVWPRARARVCFRTNGPTGYLSLEIPSVYLVKASKDAAASVTLTAPDQTTQQIEIPKNTSQGVGEANDPQERDHMLVEIRIGQSGATSVLSGDPARPWLARVNVKEAGREGSRSCSGSLVDKAWLLTSAQCFSGSAASLVSTPADPPPDATATFAGQPPIRIDYLAARTDRDLVLARLAAPVTGVTPAVLARGAAADGSALLAAGYGRTKTEWVPDSPHHSSVNQASTTATDLNLTDGQICKGDAGGPVLDGNGRIVAVQSRASHTDCLGQLGQGTNSLAARTDNIIPWLDSSTFNGIAQYSLDESTGSRRVRGGTTENFVATVAGGAELGSPGKVGGALRLNGTTGYAATPGPVVDTTKSFSVSAWVKMDNKDRNYTFVSQAGERASGFQIYYSTYYDRFIFNRHVSDTDGTDIVRAISNQAPVPGTWTHLTGSYDMVARTLSLFVNGELQSSVPFTTPWRAGGGLQIGRLRYESDWRENAQGTIDEVRAVQSTVTQADAASLAAGTLPPHLQELAYFSLDEAPGATNVDGGDGAGLSATVAGGAELGSPGKVGGALRLNGTTGYAATAGPVVDTTKSFSVSAWVKMDNKDRNYTFVSQAGERGSGFQIYYSTYYDRFIFNRHVSDTDETDIVRSLSADPAQIGVWTKLTGVYNAADQTIQLFVDGKPQQAATFTTPWRASSALQLGRLHYKGAWTENAAGAIDNVRVWTRAVEPGDIANEGITVA